MKRTIKKYTLTTRNKFEKFKIETPKYKPVIKKKPPPPRKLYCVGKKCDFNLVIGNIQNARFLTWFAKTGRSLPSVNFEKYLDQYYYLITNHSFLWLFVTRCRKIIKSSTLCSENYHWLTYIFFKRVRLFRNRLDASFRETKISKIEHNV